MQKFKLSEKNKNKKSLSTGNIKIKEINKKETKEDEKKFQEKGENTFSLKIKELEDKGFKIEKKLAYKDKEKYKVKYVKARDQYGHDFYLDLGEPYEMLENEELDFTTKVSPDFFDLKTDISSPEIEGMKGLAFECKDGVCFLKNVTDEKENYYFIQEGMEIKEKTNYSFPQDGMETKENLKLKYNNISPLFSYEFVTSDVGVISEIASEIEKKIFVHEMRKNMFDMETIIKISDEISKSLTKLRSMVLDKSTKLLTDIEMLESWDRKIKDLNPQKEEERKILEKEAEKIESIRENIYWRCTKLSELSSLVEKLTRERESFVLFCNNLDETIEYIEREYSNLDKVV